MSADSQLYVLDSSIWIELERRNRRVLNLVEPLVEQDQIVLVDLIAAEILRGAKTGSDYEILLDTFSAFPMLSASWLDVARSAHLLQRKGFKPPLTDIYIAQAVSDSGCTLITRDAHFKPIKSAMKLRCRFL